MSFMKRMRKAKKAKKAAELFRQEFLNDTLSLLSDEERARVNSNTKLLRTFRLRDANGEIITQFTIELPVP